MDKKNDSRPETVNKMIRHMFLGMGHKINPKKTAEILHTDAHHEAGHVAMDVVFGTEESLVFVEVVPAIDVESFMKSSKVRNQFDFFELHLSAALRTGNKKLARFCARTSIAQHMGGSAAVNRIAPKPDPEWYRNELEDLWEAKPNGDIYRAVSMAGRVYPAVEAHTWSPEAIELFCEGCRLADEMLGIPSVWAGTRALAEALKLKNRLSGEEAGEVMWNVIFEHPDDNFQMSVEFDRWAAANRQAFM